MTNSGPHTRHPPASGSRVPVRAAGRCGRCDVRHRAICAAVDFAHDDRLEAIVTHRWYAAGQLIFEEGERAGYVYNVSVGDVRLFKLMPDGRRQVTGFLRAGDFLGLVSGDDYAYGAEAIGEVELCCMPLAGLERLLRDLPPVRDRLLSMSRDELAAAQEQMLLLGRKTARERLLSFLLARVPAEDCAAGRVEFDLPMSRTDIADYLGLTIETVSRTFTALRKEGLIALPNAQRVVIADLPAVEAAADAA